MCKTRHTMTLVLLFQVLVTNALPNAWGQEENVIVSNTDAETKNWSVNIDGIGGWDHFTFRPACCTDERLFFELRLPNDPTLHKSFQFDHPRIFSTQSLFDSECRDDVSLQKWRFYSGISEGQTVEQHKSVSRNWATCNLQCVEQQRHHHHAPQTGHCVEYQQDNRRSVCLGRWCERVVGHRQSE